MSDDTETEIVESDPFLGRDVKGGFRVLRKLGTGGMGRVYLAEQLSVGRKVALKVLHGEYARNPDYLSRFRYEAQQAAALNHPGVVTIYDFGQTEDGSPFIAMEYVPGQTLHDIIRAGALPIERAVSFALQLAEALQEVHFAGVIHRDVKPQNIIIRAGDKLKLMDFGIARPREADDRTQATQTGAVLGTAKYMAPEYVEKGELTEQADLYAWGVILYEMLSGQVPFTGPTPTSIVVKHVTEPPRPLRERRRDVPVDLERVVMQALEKKPSKRQQGMSAAIAALQSLGKPDGEAQLPETITLDLSPRGPSQERKQQSMNEAITELQSLNKSGDKAQRSETVMPDRPSRPPVQGRKWLVGVATVLGTLVVSAAIVWLLTKSGGETLVPKENSAIEEPSVSNNAPKAEPTPPPVVAPKEPGPATGPSAEQKQEIAERVRVGTFYLDRGQYSDAIAEFEAASAIDPKDREVADSRDRARKALEAENQIRLAR